MDVLPQLQLVGNDPHWLYRSLRWQLNKHLLKRTHVTGFIPTYGVRVNVYVHDLIGLAIWSGDFESDVSRFISKYLQQGMAFFDIGANIGLFSVIGALKVGPRGQVHAFEPSPREAQRLRANVELNSLENVNINESAVTDTVGFTPFVVCTDNYGAFNAIDSVLHPAGSKHVSRVISAPTTSIDAYMDKRKLASVQLLKIDVEGSEPAVLRGGKQLLSRWDAPVLICEFSREAGHADNGRFIWEYARSCGYRWFEIGKDGALAAEVVAPPCRDFANLVATKR